MNAEHRAGELNCLEHHIGGNSHPHADKKLIEDQQRPLCQSMRSNLAAKRRIQGERKGKNKSRLDPGGNDHAAEKRRKKHEPGHAHPDREDAADDRDERDLDHFMYT